YAKDDGSGVGYKHTYAKRADVGTVCVNFYDVHGKNQVVNGAKEITVNGNGDNSIQTNAFNANEGANCVSFPNSTIAKAQKDTNPKSTCTSFTHVDCTSFVGDVVSYALTYENKGAGTAKNVVVTDTLPDPTLATYNGDCS